MKGFCQTLYGLTDAAGLSVLLPVLELPPPPQAISKKDKEKTVALANKERLFK
jgi:hypothetical protein